LLGRYDSDASYHKPKGIRSWIAVFFFASWTKCLKAWECGEFPRARTSFERALHLKRTCFASVGDSFKGLNEENRRDLRYRHLGFAIWTAFHSRHYGTRQVGAHDTSFRPTECRASKRLTLDWVPDSLKSWSWNWLGRFATAARSSNVVRLLSTRVEKKATTVVGWATSRS
jgi:hypothetical protein